MNNNLVILEIGHHYLWLYSRCYKLVTLDYIGNIYSNMITVHIYNNPYLTFSTTRGCIVREATLKDLLISPNEDQNNKCVFYGEDLR